MRIDDATMQILFVKDLVNQGDPCSRHSFVSYLKDRGRLQDFINLKTFYPTRAEFHDYLAWCAEAVRHKVRYGCEVVGVSCGPRAGSAVRGLTLSVRGLEHPSGTSVTTSSVVLAQGIRQRLPPPALRGYPVWHSA